MEAAPLKQPAVCCCAMCCVSCVQYWVRRRVLNDDMSNYKCFQGLRDGPYCCATCCSGAPFVFTAGTYGESSCPQLCLCVEVLCCPFCAFQVSREVQRAELGLGYDPTEQRVYKCLSFFGLLAHHLCCVGRCIKCGGCCVGCCLGQLEGAQDFDESSQRFGDSLLRIAHGIRSGMHWVIVIAVGCMSAQMVHESYLPASSARSGVSPDVFGAAPQMHGAPTQHEMEDSLKGSRF